jgi:transposase
MSMGRSKPVQESLFVAAEDLPSPGHVFFDRLNHVLGRHDFDRRVEDLCRPFYADRDGRPSIAPGVYFRMLLIGYFEGIDSERQIVWRCEDSLSLRRFLGLALGDSIPDHSSLSVIRRRLSPDVFKAFHHLVLEMLKAEKLLKGRHLAIDSTTMAANASMQTIVRRDTNQSYLGYVKKLAKAAGDKKADRAAAARFDRERKGRTTSNKDWESPTDPDAKIARMKDGTTRLAYKAEHLVDLETSAIVSATVNPADQSDHETAPRTVADADATLQRLATTTEGSTLVADKGYYSEALIAGCAVAEIRTCIAEPRMARRRWRGKERIVRRSSLRNRRRVRSEYGKGLLKRRAEIAERSFAHVVSRGGMRRTHLRGRENNEKRYLAQIAAFNLSLVMRKLIGVGTPKGLAALAAGLFALLVALCQLIATLFLGRPFISSKPATKIDRSFEPRRPASPHPNASSSTAS